MLRADLARELGVPSEAILTDSGGRTTDEEVARMKALLTPRGIRKILLVTGSQHMPRARQLFAGAGFDVVAARMEEFQGLSDHPGDRIGLTQALLQEWYRHSSSSRPLRASPSSGMENTRTHSQYRHASWLPSEMSTLIILGLVALTTLAAYGVGRRAFGLSPRRLVRAAGEALESVGLLIVFYLANLTAGAVLVLVARAAGYFVSLYLLTDRAMLALSFLQAMVFQRWREEE